MATDSQAAAAEGRPIPSASLGESLRFNSHHILPNFIQGLFSKKPRQVAFFSRFDSERRTVGMVEKLRRKHGGLVWVRVLGPKSLLVLDREAIAQVLDRSPRIYAEPKLKRKGMSHFQPDSLTLSRGEDWENRRRFTEAVLQTGQSTHRHAAAFLEVVRTEVAGTLSAAGRTLTWESFENLFALISRQILFGRQARSEDQLTRCLKAMMGESNRVFALRESKHFDPLYDSLKRHLKQPAPDSLVAVASRTPSTERTKVVHQLPHWMFALNDTLAANTARALALIAAHPAIERQLRGELQNVDTTDPRALAKVPLQEGCLQEAMRLWPTTPLLSREALTEDMLLGTPIPAGTQLLILNLFNHRDRETFPYADRFAPEIWQEPGTRDLFHHFSGGPQVCPGLDLALFVGQAVLAELLADRHYVLEGPVLEGPVLEGPVLEGPVLEGPAREGTGRQGSGPKGSRSKRAMPYSFDYFKLRFRAERAEPSFSMSKSDLREAQTLGGPMSDSETSTPAPSTQDPSTPDPLATKVASLTLEDLADMPLAELEELFLWASTPTIRELDGETDGRACAGKLPADHLPWMPWKGKVFEPVSDTEGRGKNRIESTFIDLFKFTRYRFETRVVPPLQGDDDVVILDYDNDDNPRMIRRIRDDLKKLRDGLFLGTANLKKDDGFRFILYFALQMKS